MWRLLRKTFAFLIEGLDVMALLPSPLLLVLDLPEMAGALDTFSQPWEKAQRNLRVTSCVSLGPSRSRCLNVMKCARILLGEGKWGGIWRRLGEPSDYDQVWSQMKKRGWVVLESKESSANPLESLQTKAGCQRSPASPRSWSVLVALLCCHWLGAALGSYGFGTNIVMDFKVQELKSLANYAPFCWRSMWHIPMATIPTLALLNHCQGNTCCPRKMSSLCPIFF